VEVTWLGHACFRLRGRETTVITDPPRPALGYSLSRLAADVVTLSHDHPGHNYGDICGEGCRVISGPGDYEVAGVFITGVQTYHDADQGKARGKNVIYAISLEEVTICHVGDLGHALTSQTIEAIGNVDVLLAPVGGHSTIGAAQAAELVAALQPKIVIPMHYRTSAEHTAALDPVERFLKEMGRAEGTAQPRLSVTKSSLPGETQVVVLEPVGNRGGGGR